MFSDGRITKEKEKITNVCSRLNPKIVLDELGAFMVRSFIIMVFNSFSFRLEFLAWGG